MKYKYKWMFSLKSAERCVATVEHEGRTAKRAAGSQTVLEVKTVPEVVNLKISKLAECVCLNMVTFSTKNQVIQIER